MRLLIIILFSMVATAVHAQMPKLKSLNVKWDAYVMPPGTSNGVLVLYKQTSLGTTYTPPKPTAYYPVSRTNAHVSVLAPGSYIFTATVRGSTLPESPPSNTVRVTVTP